MLHHRDLTIYRQVLGERDSSEGQQEQSPALINL